MRIDLKTAKIGITILATFSSTIITIASWFHSSIGSLNSRITELSVSIAALDKNLAVQTAIFQEYMRQGQQQHKKG